MPTEAPAVPALPLAASDEDVTSALQPSKKHEILALFAAAADAVSCPEAERAAAILKVQSLVNPELVLALVLDAVSATSKLQKFLTPLPTGPQHYEMRLLKNGKGAEMVPTSDFGRGWVGAYEYQRLLAQLNAKS